MRNENYLFQRNAELQSITRFNTRWIVHLSIINIIYESGFRQEKRSDPFPCLEDNHFFQSDAWVVVLIA